MSPPFLTEELCHPQSASLAPLNLFQLHQLLFEVWPQRMQLHRWYYQGIMWLASLISILFLVIPKILLAFFMVDADSVDPFVEHSCCHA